MCTRIDTNFLHCVTEITQLMTQFAIYIYIYYKYVRIFICVQMYLRCISNCDLSWIILWMNERKSLFKWSTFVIVDCSNKKKY